MQTIQAINYKIVFENTGYEFLAETLKPQFYSKIFIIVDENTSNQCLPYFLANLSTKSSAG